MTTKPHPKEEIRQSLENILVLSEDATYEEYIKAEIKKIKQLLSKLK